MRRAAVVAMLAVSSAMMPGVLYPRMAQLAKFVLNGRIDSTDSPDILNVAFKDPSGSLVLIASNDKATLCRSTPR